MNPRSPKLIVATLLCALCVAFGVTSAYAQDPTPEPNAEECIGCHEGLRGHWENSPHGRSTTDPSFLFDWREQGSPQECLTCHTTGYDPATGTYLSQGVNCLTCHSPVPTGHPDTFMPTDDSSEKCGSCHLETYSEWEDSSHGAEDMTCNQCHNPHTSDVRAENSQQLCQSCHDTESHYFSFTGHAEEGLLCTDCHLRVNESTDGNGHSQRHHTFKVDLHTCNACHKEDMHSEVNTANTNALEADSEVTCEAETLAAAMPTPMPSRSVMSAEPTGPSPLLYAVPAGIGLIFGTLLAPSLSRAFAHRKDEDNDEEENS